MTERMIPLDGLWNFDDPAGSEARFRERLGGATGDAALEVVTQIARAQGLQGRFGDAHRTLDEIEGAVTAAGDRVRVRHLLERGRVLRSSGSPELAIGPFTEALQVASGSGQAGLAVDAAHMLAISEADPARRMAWHERAIGMAEDSDAPEARRWLPSLRNNLGWELFEAGRFEAALAQFERAAAERRAAGADERAVRIADWAVARALRSLGRVDEALAIQRRIVEQARAAGGAPDAAEEAGECLVALGRPAEAREFFRAAYALLSAGEPRPPADPQRLARLKRLAEPPG